MDTRQEKNISKWQRALLLTILLLLGMILLTFESAVFSGWMLILFCWGDVLIFSAVPIILFAILADKPFPNPGSAIDGLPWGLAGVFALLTLYVLIISNIYAGIELKYELSFFGVLIGIIGYVLGWWFRRRTMTFIAVVVLPYVWLITFENNIKAALFSVGGIIGSIALVSWWNRVSPPTR